MSFGAAEKANFELFELGGTGLATGSSAGAGGGFFHAHGRRGIHG